MTRRTPGSGCIYQRADGRWTARIYLIGNERREVYARTKEDAETRLAELLAIHGSSTTKGTSPDWLPQQLPDGRWVVRWRHPINGRQRQSIVATRAEAGHIRSAVRRGIVPKARRARRAVALAVRFRVLERYGFRCTYCGAPASETKLLVDHIVPRALGGTNEEENLTAACSDCNVGKGARSLEAQKA